MTIPNLKDLAHWSTEIEEKITKQWRSAEAFRFNEKTKKRIYSIDTPPPYVNAPVHIGHAITYCYMDFFARYRRMKGYEVIFPLGLDRNGLPIELAAEKKYNISPFHTDRETFVSHCKKLLEESSLETADTFAKLGISFTSYLEGDHIGAVYKTDSKKYRQVTQDTFIDLFRMGAVYEDNRINNWDTKLQTTIADSEIEYAEIPSTFNHVVWKVKETGEDIIVATTRPELICTCAMVIYNPEDKRYKKLNGKTAITPIFGKEVPIAEHPFAQIDKGTGLVMMCSAGDVTDIQFFREMNLTPIISIEKDGKMNEHAGLLRGLKVKEARQKIIEELKKEKLLHKQEHITHRTPISERTKTEVEFIAMSEWYLKQLEVKDKIRAIANTMAFYPESSKNILETWIDQITIDWPISRRRFYATPIPLWHAGEHIAVPKKGTYYEPWKEPVPRSADVFLHGNRVGTVLDFPKLKWEGETRVFDTWMDSSISELVLLKYGENNAFFNSAFPATLRPQGKEIVRTWLYYTLLRGYYATKKPAFNDAWIHQHILDGKGRKMSKSLGNVVDPQKLIAIYGAEALRFWAATEGDLSKQDIACSEERIKAEQKTINKLINVAKFVATFPKAKKPKTLTNTDKLFIAYLDELTAYTDKEYEHYNFYHPLIKLRHFLWEVFASHYLEMVKTRAYNEQKTFSKDATHSAHYTLHALLERLLILLSPVIPQVTSVLQSSLKYENEAFPIVKKTKTNANIVEAIMDFNKDIWKKKKDAGLSLRAPLKITKFPKELTRFKDDIVACHALSL